jgi:hypothetical protein
MGMISQDTRRSYYAMFLFLEFLKLDDDFVLFSRFSRTSQRGQTVNVHEECNGAG